MYTIKFDGKEAAKMLNNIVEYSNGFIKETEAREQYLANKLGNMSIDAFYEYLDGLARTNPGMLHHVYEWGQVGNPEARLVELKKQMSGKNSVNIISEFIQSNSIPHGGSEPFYEKAQIMEDGIEVTIYPIKAKALFFEWNGEEFFTAGPVVVANPGGEATRGSFLSAFEEFYNVYFDKVYLNAIRFYDNISNASEFAKNFKSAIKSGNASAVGQQTALSWIIKSSGGTYE